VSPHNREQVDRQDELNAVHCVSTREPRSHFTTHVQQAMLRQAF
jgi:hypothetical protein